MTSTARTGVCVCGVAAVSHYDDRNHFLSCADLRMSATAASPSLKETLAEALQTSQTAQQQVEVGQPIPDVLVAADLMRIFRLSKSAFYRQRADFKAFEIPSLRATRYSGALVRRAVNGEGLRDRVFGGSRGPRAVGAR